MTLVMANSREQSGIDAPTILAIIVDGSVSPPAPSRTANAAVGQTAIVDETTLLFHADLFNLNFVTMIVRDLIY